MVLAVSARAGRRKTRTRRADQKDPAAGGMGFSAACPLQNECTIGKQENRTMNDHPWVREFGAAVTVCDTEGIILEMNDRSARMFRE